MSTRLPLELDRPRRKSSTTHTPSDRHLQTNDVRLAGRFAARDFFRRIGQAQTVVARRLLRPRAAPRASRRALRRAEALERVARFEQLLARTRDRSRERSLCRYGPCGPPTSGPSSHVSPHQCSESRIACSLSGGAARLIGVLDAQDELAAVLLGEAIVDQRDVSRADVRVARRRRRDPRAYSFLEDGV